VIAELVDGAVADGARVVLGGTRPEREGFYYDPTVLLDVPRTAGILGEEIFGPEAPIVTFTDEADAIRMANDTEYDHVGMLCYLESKYVAVTS
jgi:succinate-semialdehyde dehydrogenase/glutarate-semialdehyde dehydrogenase